MTSRATRPGLPAFRVGACCGHDTDHASRIVVRPSRRLFVLVALVGLVVLFRMASAVSRLVIWRTQWQPGIRFFRRYSKIVDNPMTLRTAGRPGNRMTAVHHRGRRSGRDYVTPVWAEHVGQSFYIQLPYGTDVDWCRNVLAARGCTLEHDGVSYDAVDAEIVPAAHAIPLLSAGLRRMQRLAGVDSYLRLDATPAGEPLARGRLEHVS